MKFSNTIIIAKDPEILFTYLSDITKFPEWNYALIQTKQVTPGKPTIGTSYHQKRQFMGEVLDDIFAITELRQDRLLTIVSQKAKYPFKISYDLNPSDGGTILTNNFELSGGVFDLLGFLMVNRVKDAVSQNLNVLKGIVEAK